MTSSINCPSPVDILLLGSGWSSSFLLPLLSASNLTFASTSRDASSSSLQPAPLHFECDATSPSPSPSPSANSETSSVDEEMFKKLPRARTVVIVFPIKAEGAVERLVNAYEGVHGSTRWIQLGSTGVWNSGRITSSTPPDLSNPRARSEEELLSLDSQCHPHSQSPSSSSRHLRRTVVLNLAGLYGGTRQPRNFCVKVCGSKDALRGKGSVHFVHGEDVARAVLLLHRSEEKGWGRRWIVTDTNVYDWWSLFLTLSPSLPSVDTPTKARWVPELMAEHDVSSLPRPLANGVGQEGPAYLQRAMDGTEFWKEMESEPKVGRADEGEQLRVQMGGGEAMPGSHV